MSKQTRAIMHGRGNSKSFTQRFIKLLFYTTVIASVVAGIWWLDSEYNIISDNTDFDDIIYKKALKYGVDPLLVKAVIWRESKFKINRRGSAGEIGLMQIMPKSATKASVVEDWERAHKVIIRSEGSLFYPETNIDIGTWYLSKAIGHWSGYRQKYELALCEYNKGKRRVNEWVKGMHKDGNIMERVDSDVAKKYVKSIIVQYHYYKMKENEKY